MTDESVAFGSSRRDKPLWVIDLGRCAYHPAWAFQKELQQLRIRQLIPDVMIFVEHPPVYTIGKNGTENHVIASERFLAGRNIKVIPVDRGGDVTYHGPGQLVGYPIFDLHQHRKSVSFYMRRLEGVFIEVLREWDLVGVRNEGYSGVWIGDEKIVALGVRIARWVTMHGFAFNVNPDLTHFDGIIPCGIFHMGVTSLEKSLGRPTGIAEVKRVVQNEFQNMFEFTEVVSKTVDCSSLAASPENAAEVLQNATGSPLIIDQENTL